MPAARNKEKALEVNRRWRDRHREQERERCRTYHKSLSGRLTAIRNNSRVKGRKCDLTLEQVEPLWQAACVYCGQVTPTLNLDRIDSNGDYTIGNVVPCCQVCNQMKSDRTVEDFLKHVKMIMGYTNA